MLHKSFKPSKCKTSLRLATSRIKLMKNKKGVQINQMKKDLAQLLETGQDRTARIRVEHVIREEKMVAAYELIEIYCELIVARLPIIESQKTCPIDLKEAVTSVIFAAPRCSDISELADIRKQFTAKYGKEFVSAAIELRPDCGVSRMLIEKLSAVAPDLQTKIKVLSGVAKDHNINWDPTSFDEKETKPPSDLLNGPANLEKASISNADFPKIQPLNNNNVHSHEEKHNAPFDAQNITSSTATHQDVRSSDIKSERVETRPPVSRDDNDFSTGRQDWNMEFKDATSAAQAAAEAAERAAMAARAAAQFSSQEKLSMQRPTRSHISNNKDETPRVSKDSYERFSDDRKPNMLNQRIDQSQHDTSQKATETFHVADDEYFEEYVHEDQEDSSSSELTIPERSKESRIDLGSGENGSFETENINLFAEEATKKPPGILSSDEADVADHRIASKRIVVGNPFAVVDQANPFREATETTDSNVDDVAVSDDDDVSPRFDTGFDYDEIEATSYSLENTNIWSPRKNKSTVVDKASSQSHLFSESLSFGEHSVKSIEPSETDDHEPASFDHSDGPDSENESEKKEFTSNVPRKTRIELNDLVDENSSFYDPEEDEKKPQPQHESKKHNFDKESYDDTFEDNNDSVNQSNVLDIKKELNFGTLTGGLRNKGGLRYPPYTKSAPTDASYFSNKSIKKSSDSDSDSDEKASKHANTSRVHMVGSGVSRRTRGSPSVSYSKSHVEPEPKTKPEPKPKPEPKTVISSFNKDRNPNDYSYSDEVQIPAEPRSYARKFKEDAKEISESPPPFRPSRRTAEMGSIEAQIKPSKRSGYSKETLTEPRIDHSVNTKEEAVKIPTREPIESGKTKTEKFKKLTEEILVKKPSHVHPKLPDFESLAARVQSLRNNDQ